MAVNPAAKDPNSYASSTLSGGNSATGAILGVPQDPNTPRGPQPTALPQGMPGGVPNFFASASGGQTAQPQGLSVPGMDAYSQVTQQNQQVIAQMFQPKADATPQYGLGPNGELQVGDTVVPMKDNPTMAAQLLQTPAAKGPTNLRPGFQPVDASEVQNYLQNLNRSTWDATKEVGKQFAGGVVGGGLDVAGRAAQWAGAPNVGAGLIGAGQAADRFLGTDQPADTLNRGTLAKGFIGNARAAGMAIPVAAANLGLTAAGMPGAAAVLDIGVVAPLFGAADAQQTHDQILQAGGSPEQAQSAGWKQFFISGGTQAALGAIGGRVMAGGGYTAVTKLKQAVSGGAMTADQAAQIVTNPAMLKRFAANEGINLGVQSAGMAGQGAASAALYNASTPEGTPQRDVGEAGLEGAGAGLYMGAMMAPMGAYHQWGDSARRADLGRALNTPTTQVDLLNAVKMDQAAKAIQPEMGGLIGKPGAEQYTKDTMARSTDAYSDNLIAAEKAARNETPGFGGQAPAGIAPAPDAGRQADLTAAFPPLTAEQQAAQGEQAKSTKAAAKAQREQHELNATDALIGMGVAQPGAKDVRIVADALAAGIDMADPAAAPFREAVMAKKYSLAKKALADLKGKNDSVFGQAGAGDAGLGGDGSGKPAGSVGAGVPDSGDAGGGVRPSTGEPVAGVQPPVAGGDAGVHTHTVEEIPDFSLEHTPGEPNAAWRAAHPHESDTAPVATNNLSLRHLKETGQEPLFTPEVTRKKLLKPTKSEGDTAAYVAPEQKPSITAEQAYNRLKRSGHPEYSQLTPEEQRVVEAAHAEGRVTQAEWDKAMKQAIRQQREERLAAAKQNRKRIETDRAQEAAMTDEERAARKKKERAEDTSVSPEEHFVEAFGASGPAAYAAAHGDTWEAIAKQEGISADAARKRVARIDPADIDAADLTPKEKDKLRESLEYAQGDVVEKRDRAANASGSADTEIGGTSPESQSMERELLVTPGMNVQNQGRTGILTRPENEKGRGEELSTKEATLAEQSKALEAELQDALKAKDYKKAAEIRERQKSLAAEFAKGKEDPLKAPEKSERQSTEARINEINDLINDAEEAGEHKKVKALEKERQDLYDLRDAEAEKAERAQEDDIDEDAAGNSDDYQYGKNSDGTAENGYESAEELTKELTGWMGVDKLPRHIKVVHDASELADLGDLATAAKNQSAFGWTKDGRVVLIANRLTKGTGKGAFLHEVGVHLGLDNILGSKNIDRLHEAIKEWAARDDGSKESEIAKAALARVEAAGTESHQAASEAVAYFVQEAADRGVSPTAVDGYSGKFAHFVRMIYAAFKGAIRRVLRGGDLTKLSAEDMVNMAYGAARLEMAGTWHGTAAEFRKFRHEYMGSGEGAQAYGWGTYLAERVGIAKGYHEADVRRKATDNVESLRAEAIAKRSKATALYQKAMKYELAGEGKKVIDGMRDRARTLEAQARDADAAAKTGARPEGTLFRVDHTVAPREMLDWDKAEQTPHVQEALAKLWDDVETDIREEIEDNLNADVTELSGKEWVRKVLPKLRDMDSRVFDRVDPVGGMPTHEAVSKLLDSFGIKGSKHLDARSRDSTKEIVVGGKAYSRDDLLAMTAKGRNGGPQHELYDQVPILREILRHGVEATRAEYTEKVNQHKLDGERIARESAARYDVPITDAEARQHGEEYARGTYHATNLKWLNENASKIKVQSQPVTHNHVIFNDKNLVRAASMRGGDRSQIKFGKTTERNIAKLPEKYQEPARTITDTLSRWANSGLDKVVFTKDLVDRGVARGLTALSRYQELVEGRNTRAGHFEKMAYNAIEDVRTFSLAEKRALNKFIQHSNLSGEWGYGDKARGQAKKMFEDLSPRTQKVAKAIFEHGDTILKQKKESVQQVASDLYDSMLEGATGKARDDILAEKDGFLKKYNTLMAIDAGNPYSSLQRHGDFVTVGKSDAYLKAEAAAKAEGSSKAQRQALMDMQADPQHYLVSAAHDEAEAKVLRQNMRDAGFPVSDEHTYYKPKDTWIKDLTGGTGVIAGMSRLRHQLDMMSSESSSPADKLKYASMSRLLSNMWLDALSQNSARKSEMRRLGVHGEMDTIEAFRSAAKSDAHFIAGIEFNDKMLQTLKQAAKQVEGGSGEERTTKDNIMKEFMARHEQGVVSPPTPWANKITKATALWQIATSPAHYVGNLMQPWTMTLPTLAAKHGYGEATGEFFKAYKEIGAILANTGLLKSLKVEDMPADVRQPMKRLLELGRLDIGMNTEYGSMSMRERGAGTRALNAATDRITSASLKMESLNRLATAASAYRLELKRTGDPEKALHYAGDIVAETHGDHSRANAPRAFNNGFGKVALQFRKFQLVQLTQMAKMIGNLKNADPAERALALRTLAFTLAHVAALGGAVGMPGFNTFSWAASQMQHALTGVTGEDWETQIAKASGDTHTANLLLRGLPGLLGVDLTSKVGYGDMLGIAPYVDADLADRKSVQDAVGQIAAGPFGGLVGRAAQSLHHLLVGNTYKAWEGLMPQGVANVMKGARELNEGVTNTKGDKLTNINAGEAMLEALGFAPSSKALMQAETGAMIKSSEDFKDRLAMLKERYTNTVRDGGDVSGDVKAMNSLRQQMMDRGFKPTPLGDLLKAPTQQLIRQIFTTPGGLQYKPGKDQRAAEQFPQ